MITPHNIRGVIFLPYNSLKRDVAPQNKKGILNLVKVFANMAGTILKHRGVKNLT